MNSVLDETVKQSPALPAWLFWIGAIIAGGFLLVAHGCHGNEDKELMVVPGKKQAVRLISQ